MTWRPETAAADAARLGRTRRPRASSTAACRVVFDLHDESGDSEGYDDLETDEVARFHGGGALAARHAGGSCDGALYDFLQAVGLAPLGGPLGGAALSLEACVRACAQDRTAFLQRLRDAGVAKVADRQAFANSIGKATRAGWLRAPYKGPFTEAGRELRLAREGGRGP